MKKVIHSVELTQRQRAVLRWIEKTYASRGYGVGVREVAKAFGWSSPNAAYSHLTQLEKGGYITKAAKRANYIIPAKGA